MLIIADMSKIYTEIFDPKRLAVWKRLREFSDVGVLVGGTALALQLDHRKSYDFDIFCDQQIPKKLLMKVRKVFWEYEVEPEVDSGDELSVLLSGDIRLSFVFFPFPRLKETVKTESIDLFSVDDLLSNKAYVIGRRGMWRDYADIYWVVKNEVSSLKKIINETKVRFNGVFAEKLFLEQLVYFDDLREDTVEWVGAEVKNEEIKKALMEMVKKYLVS